MRQQWIVLMIVPAMLQSQAPSVAPAILPVEDQVAAAVLPLPEDLRASATVMGYNASGKLVTLREGTGGMNCLASDPAANRFHVACYHKSLEPFMARGRELRAQGIRGDQVDTVRFREVREGKLKLPESPALLYSLTGDRNAFDPATKTAKGRPLFVVYIPYATSESTGLSARPAQGIPWVMYPGTPKAHIMFTPSMNP